MKPPVRVTVTGAAGQISYGLLFRIAAGNMLGPDQPVILQLLEIPPAMNALNGVVMELNDCAFPLLDSIVATDDANVAFADSEYALLVGAMPRKKGMLRKDLLEANSKIFSAQGKAINDNAKTDIRVLVVGNPANTNALITAANAPNIKHGNITAMTRLDHNRAISLLSDKMGASSNEVKKMTIWGNHSATQYPDFTNAKIKGQPVTEVISDHDWLKGEFISTVQKRGAAIIKARGLSSAASAANAVVDTVSSLTNETAAGDWHSVAVCSPGAYGIEQGLMASMPIRTNADGSWSVVEGVPVDEFSQGKLDATINELLEEKAAVQDLIPA